eukprot:202804_1
MSKSHFQVVVFDWDDTLFPKTQLQKGSALSIDQIRSLTQSVYQLLQKYIEVFGADNVNIITNGKEGWVLKSLEILNEITRDNAPCIALIRDLISRKQLTVVSGQKLFAKKHPKQPYLWKRMAITQLLYKQFVSPNLVYCAASMPKPVYTLICVGDSKDEYEGSMKAANWIHCKYKTKIMVHRVKLKPKPQLKYMMNEIKLLHDLAHVFHSPAVCTPVDIDYHKERLRYTPRG